jgi:putative copper export protein
MIGLMVSISAYFVWFVSSKGDGDLFKPSTWNGADQHAFGSITILFVGLLGMLYVATMVKSRK